MGTDFAVVWRDFPYEPGTLRATLFHEDGSVACAVTEVPGPAFRPSGSVSPARIDAADTTHFRVGWKGPGGDDGKPHWKRFNTVCGVVATDSRFDDLSDDSIRGEFDFAVSDCCGTNALGAMLWRNVGSEIAPSQVYARVVNW
jgi:hypothetical protein